MVKCHEIRLSNLQNSTAKLQCECQIIIFKIKSRRDDLFSSLETKLFFC